MYKLLLRPLFFLMSPETAHHLVFRLIRFSLAIPGIKFITKKIYTVDHPLLQTSIFGLNFKNPVGLGAGFDKDAKLFDELHHYGFGFVEVGTLTPLPQPGNDKPRMFRLPADQGLINRMGFNNEGVQAAIERLKKKNTNIIIGGNIGKNKLTPNENALDDYKKCFIALFDHVDFFTVNVSSPNTPNLRELQEKEPLKKLLNEIVTLNREQKKPKPVLLKIAPDLTNTQLDDIIEIVKETGINGIIATNTTISRDGLKTDENITKQMGGLSGKPLTKRSTEVIRYISKKSNETIPIIGIGGIHSAQDAIDKIKAGASLVQIYTGFIYEGPSLVKKINKAILQYKQASHG